VPKPLPKRLLYAEPVLRRKRFGGTWIADSEHALLLFEPGRYPVAYFPETGVSPDTLQRSEHTTRHQDLGFTSGYTLRAGEQSAPRGPWQHIDQPAHASELQARVAFARPAMDAFYEEEERIVGHAGDRYHRIDIRQTSCNIVVRHRDSIIADTKRPVVLCISELALFEPDMDSVQLDGTQLRLEPGQTVIPHGSDRNFTVAGAYSRR
jgi:uncharacterized protein (DUF427 family)